LFNTQGDIGPKIKINLINEDSHSRHHTSNEKYQSTTRGEFYARSQSNNEHNRINTTYYKDGPTSPKTLKGWNDGLSRGKNSPGKKPDMDAVYLHTKNDMESLEKYINMNDDVLKSERKSRTPSTYHRNINTHNLVSTVKLSPSAK
jgi:hypothetical protein